MQRCFFYSLFLCIFIIGKLYSQVSPTLSYQGMLTTSGNEVAEEGIYEMHFNLYTETDPSAPIWSETQNVTVLKGVFNIILGSVNPLELPFDEQYYLGIAIGEEPELSPRIVLTASAYSFRARSIDDGQVVKSINELRDNITLEAGENVSITEDENKIIISATSSGGTGNITQITAGEGLTGGGSEGEVSLAVDDGGITSDKLSDLVVTTEKISDNAVTGSKIANSHVVRSINDLTDAVYFAAEGGATITTREDTLFINAGSGGNGSGIQGIQNTNNTLDILQPSGPTTTINIKNEGIGTQQIEDGAVSSSKIASGAVDLGGDKVSGTLGVSGGGTGATTAAAARVNLGLGTLATRNMVETTHIVDGAVTQQKIGPDVSLPISGSAGGDLTGTYPDPQIAEGAITSDKILDDQIVRSINSLKDNVILESGPNISINSEDSRIIISSEIENQWERNENDIYNNNSGNVGVGTSAPQARLHVEGTLRAVGIRTVEHSTSPNIIMGNLNNNVNNDAFGQTISGGAGSTFPNRTGASYATVGGGSHNQAIGTFNTISGGSNNRTEGVAGAVGGGNANRATGDYSSVSGGNQNQASAQMSHIGGGSGNNSGGFSSAISGGFNNTVNGNYSMIPGGRLNTASGNYSFAAGRRAKADHDGVFLWADQTDSDFASTGVNQFLIRAGGGVGIGTNNPGGFMLAVNGTAAKPGGGSWSSFSDKRLKQDIKPIEPGILNHLLTLRGYTFEYLDSAIENRLALPGRQVGLIAQEVMEVFPEWVDTDEEGFLYVTERGTTALFVEALRELRREMNDELENLSHKLNDKNNRIRELENRVELLENLLRENFILSESPKF